MVPNPQTNACQGRGEGGNPEGKSLQRGIAPRLIIGREQRQVHAAEKVVVGHVEDAVVPVKVRRDKVDFNLVSKGINQSGFPESAGYGVILRVLQVMGYLRGVILVGAVMAGRNHDEGLNAATFIAGTVQLVQGVDENVDTLVAELVPAADSYIDCVGGDLLRTHGAGNCLEALTGGIVKGVILLI